MVIVFLISPFVLPFLRFVIFFRFSGIVVVKTTNLELQTCMDTGFWFRYLLIFRIDSLYVPIGEAVRYNWQTVRVWRLWVSPSIHGESGVK